MGGEWEENGKIMGGEWEENGRNPQKLLMQSVRISVQPAQEVVSADSRSAISRPSEHRLPTEKNRLIRYSE